MLNDEQMTHVQAAKTALLAAERAHPGDPNLKLLHARLAKLAALAASQGIMSQAQADDTTGGNEKDGN